MTRLSTPRPVRGAALAVVALTLALTGPPAAAAPSPVDAVDKAAACLRRGDAPCAELEATRALALEPAPALRREALALRAKARALSDAADAAEADYAALLELWPGFRLAPDEDPRLAAALAAARAALLARRLPPTLDRGPLPPPPAPATAELLGPPLLYAPEDLLAATGQQHERAFRLSLGAGVAFPTGAASDRYQPGIAASIDLGYALSDLVALWGEVVISLLPLDGALPVEPGLPGGITQVSGVVGVMLNLPVAPDVELVVAGGVGGGGFGLGDVSTAAGFAAHGLLGGRYVVAPQLAFRLDLVGQVVAPTSGDIGAAGHLTLLLRGETAF